MINGLIENTSSSVEAPPCSNKPREWTAAEATLLLLESFEKQKEDIQRQQDRCRAELITTLIDDLTAADDTHPVLHPVALALPGKKAWGKWLRYHQFCTAYPNLKVTKASFDCYWKQFSDPAMPTTRHSKPHHAEIWNNYIENMHGRIAHQLQHHIPPEKRGKTPRKAKARQLTFQRQLPQATLADLHTLWAEMQAPWDILAQLLGQSKVNYAPDLIASCAATLNKGRMRIQALINKLS